MAFLSLGMMWDCLRVSAIHANSKYSSVMANSIWVEGIGIALILIFLSLSLSLSITSLSYSLSPPFLKQV